MFGEWASRAIQDIERKFGPHDEDRLLRITGLVRHFISNPDYADLRDHAEGTQQTLPHPLVGDLASQLVAQPGDTIEDRWNHLMDDLDFQQYTDSGVYLQSWAKYTEEKHGFPGVTTSWGDQG